MSNANTVRAAATLDDYAAALSRQADAIADAGMSAELTALLDELERVQAERRHMTPEIEAKALHIYSRLLRGFVEPDLAGSQFKAGVAHLAHRMSCAPDLDVAYDLYFSSKHVEIRCKWLDSSLLLRLFKAIERDHNVTLFRDDRLGLTRPEGLWSASLTLPSGVRFKVQPVHLNDGQQTLLIEQVRGLNQP